MDQEKRVLLAFALSFGLLVLWRAVFFKPALAPPEPTAPVSAQKNSNRASGASTGPSLPKSFERVTLPAAQAENAEEIAVESAFYRVVLSNQGAVVKSWVLKKYQDEDGKPLDVVNGPAGEKAGFPMSLALGDLALSTKLNSALFLAKPSGGTFQAPAKLRFVYSDRKIQVTKIFSFDTGYRVEVEVSVFDGQRYLPVAVAWPGGFGDHSLLAGVQQALSLAVYGSPQSIETLSESKVKEDRSISGPFDFAGLEDRYFVGLFLPSQPGEAFPGSVSLKLAPGSWTPPEGKENEPPKFLSAWLSSAAASPLKFRVFVAPKELEVLGAQTPPLDGLVDFGFFKWFAKPLFLALRFIYEHWVHNYGWAIIILTLFINMAMFPLKLKQIRSAQEMQKIAPLVKSIQDRYKQYKLNDPRKQRMNQEVMKLYKEHNINPLGGCLPLVLQIPFLYGFYRVLELPIELRHAPWIGWVKDLAAPETLHLFGYAVHVLPIVMVVTMFLMQKMTPMPTADPSQQRMMMIMPVMFAFMFYRLASGLVLYFLVANMVGIAQQMFINKIAPSSATVPAPPRTAAVRD